MQLNTVIFDMDGLLIDSEPMWHEAADEVFISYGIKLSEEQHISSTGMRTKEFVKWWLGIFKIAESEFLAAEKKIIETAIEKIRHKGKMMPGMQHIVNFFYERNFKMGIASASPQELIDVVMDMSGIRNYIQSTASAQLLPFGKPHPQVYLNCAQSLGADPLGCLCFEDSFPGLIAAKAARMKCVVVPHYSQQNEERWGAADLKLSSLQNFGALHLNML